MNEFNQICITKTAATVERLLQVTPDMTNREPMAEPIWRVLDGANTAFHGENCDRVFLYNPDAIAMWIYEKYKDTFVKVEENAALKLPMLSVFPPVTPVCFASMYSGLLPEKHGIREYIKPVLTVKTMFDDLIAAGKKPAIVSTANDSISMIFLNRDMDYFIYKTKEECNQKALSLIEEDKYDLIVLYNGDYDHYMHHFSPEGKRSLRALRENTETYVQLHKAIEENWQEHNTALFFSPDHGCHRKYGILGSHGVNEPCDMNIMHFYDFI